MLAERITTKHSYLLPQHTLTKSLYYPNCSWCLLGRLNSAICANMVCACVELTHLSKSKVPHATIAQSSRPARTVANHALRAPGGPQAPQPRDPQPAELVDLAGGCRR